jgi:hypothetical protein
MLLVFKTHIVWFAFRDNSAITEEQRAIAETLDRRKVVGNKDDGSARFLQSLYMLQTLPLKWDVTNGKNLVEEKNVGIQVRRDRKAQAEAHTSGVPLYRNIDKISNP